MGDFHRLYTDFKDGVSFSMIPAVRNPKGKCIDEKNCNFERYTLCAWDSEKDLDTQVKFLDCLDTPWSDLLTMSKAKKCVKSVGTSASDVQSCYDGSRGDQLLSDASASFVSRFPKPVNMPQTMVNGKSVDASYDDVKKAVCASGASVPACK